MKQTISVLVLLSFLAFTGCPKLPPVTNCTPFVQSCINNMPHVCSASRRQEPAGDVSCGAVGGVCIVNDAGVAHCARVRDGYSE